MEFGEVKLRVKKLVLLLMVTDRFSSVNKRDIFGCSKFFDLSLDNTFRTGKVFRVMRAISIGRRKIYFKTGRAIFVRAFRTVETARMTFALGTCMTISDALSWE